MSRWKTIFSVREKDGIYKISYDKDLDSISTIHKLPGALYLLMVERPELIEEIMFAGTQAAEKLTEPFEDILNERE